MFGLEQDRKKKGVEIEKFDLQKEMLDPTKSKALKDRLDKRILELKNLLRSGAESEDFDELGVLLHGYVALQNLMTRVKRKK